MMMLLLGSLRRGLLSMIPNLLPVVATLGVMGWLDIPLDVSTIMIGAIVIGIAVDDTVHRHLAAAHVRVSVHRAGHGDHTARQIGVALDFGFGLYEHRSTGERDVAADDRPEAYRTGRRARAAPDTSAHLLVLSNAEVRAPDVAVEAHDRSGRHRVADDAVGHGHRRAGGDDVVPGPQE